MMHACILYYSVPARPISEGAAPCPYWLAPCPIYTRFTRALPDLHAPCPIYTRPARFTRALPDLHAPCPIYTRPARFTRALPDLHACRFVPMFSSIAHKTKFWSFTRKRFCVCVLNCARILVVRALDCAQFLLHPALFPI